MYPKLSFDSIKLNSMKKTHVLMLLMLIPLQLLAQKSTAHTLAYDENASGTPKATLEDVKWITGHWRGEAFGGTTEEIWSPPLGNSMMGSFKLVVGQEVQFYELMTIAEEEGTLILRLKHFHGDLKGWEEKDETVDFKLVAIAKDRVFFDNLTFEKISDNSITVYVVVEEEEGKSQEMAFPYQRYD